MRERQQRIFTHQLSIISGGFLQSLDFIIRSEQIRAAKPKRGENGLGRLNVAERGAKLSPDAFKERRKERMKERPGLGGRRGDGEGGGGAESAPAAGGF